MAESVGSAARSPRLQGWRSTARYGVYALLAAVAMILLLQTGRGGPKTGSVAADFVLARVDAPGETLDLQSLHGQPILIEVFAAWCPSCRKAAPMMAELYAEGAPRGIEFLGVSVDESHEQARATVANWKIAFPVVLDDGSFSRNYQIKSLPTFIAIDASGRVHHTTSGLPWQRRLRSWLDDIAQPSR